MKTKSVATEDDAKIGLKVKKLRMLKGISQNEFGIELDVSFQQIQKYERGVNRISAVNLQKISKILGVPINSFFEEDNAIDPLKLDKQTELLFKIWSVTSPKEKDDILAIMKLLNKNRIKK